MRGGRVKITKGQSGEVKVTLPYNPVHIENLKEIEGHRWNPEQKCWVFPCSDDVVKKILVLFKDENIWIDPSLRQGKENKTPFEDLRKEMVSLSANRRARVQ